MINCDICNCKKFIVHYKILNKCQNCGHIFASENLSPEELKNIYKEKYFFGDEYVDYIGEEDCLKINFISRQKIIEKYISPKNKKLLEIGCAYGFYLDVVKNKFKKIEGIDISKKAIIYAKKTGNHDVYEGDFMDLDFKNKNYDMVCMWDTIEHLKSPNNYIAKIQKLLSKKGIFAFTTGDISSFVASFRKHKWRMIHPPTHIHYFSKKSVQDILEANNFRVLSITYPSTYRTLDNILYNLFVLRKKMPWVYNFSRMLGITRLKIKLNLFDIMLVIAQKNDFH